MHAIFTSLGVPTAKLSFITGSDYQLSKEYSLDNFRCVGVCVFAGRDWVTDGLCGRQVMRLVNAA